jgi:hypothetical protein
MSEHRLAGRDDEKAAYPEILSELTGEMSVRARSAWDQANKLIKSIEQLYHYYLAILPEAVLVSGRTLLRGRERDFRVEVMIASEIN